MGRQAMRLDFETLNALEKIESPQCRCGAHPRINQQQYRDHRALLVFLKEVQAVIDERQKNEVRNGPIGVAQDSHGRVPIGPNTGPKSEGFWSVEAIVGQRAKYKSDAARPSIWIVSVSLMSHWRSPKWGVVQGLAQRSPRSTL